MHATNFLVRLYNKICLWQKHHGLTMTICMEQATLCTFALEHQLSLRSSHKNAKHGVRTFNGRQIMSCKTDSVTFKGLTDRLKRIFLTQANLEFGRTSKGKRRSSSARF